MKRIFGGPAQVVWAIAIFFIVAVVLSATQLIVDSRKADINHSQEQAVRFLNSSTATLNRQLLSIDVLLASVDGLLHLSKATQKPLDNASASKVLAGLLRQDILIRSISLVDNQGRMMASSYPLGQKATLDPPVGFIDKVISPLVSTLVVSSPAVNFNTTENVLYFARHIRLADDNRVVAIAEIQIPQLIAVLIQGVDIAGLQSTLERSNGELLGSEPALDNLLGKQLSPPLSKLAQDDPALFVPGRLDGTNSLVVTRSLIYPDLWIAASIPMATVLQAWERNSNWTIGVAAAFCLVILGTAFFAVWHFKRMAQVQCNIATAKATLDQALESMDNGFLLLNARMEVVSWNRRFLEMFPEHIGGMAPGVPFRRLMEIGAPDHLPDSTAPERDAWVEKRMVLMESLQGSHERTMPDGSTIQITDRRTPDGGVVVVYQDISRMRKAALEIQHLAFYDPLTGLPNRRLLTDRLQSAIANAKRTGNRGALLFLDLDNFKTLNDTAGHDVGDQFLKQVGARIRACVRDMDTVARLGGDEFVVMLQGLSPSEMEADLQAQVVADNVLASVSKSYFLGGNMHSSTCSIGVTVFSDGQQSSADLLKQADIAMYQVKTKGRNGVCFFNTQMLDSLTSRADLERDLRLALDNDEFLVHYQIQMAEPQRPVGAEVLVRWYHPAKGLVSPLEFIGVAEETGLIVPLGLWVLQAACQQLQAWQTVPGREHLQLSVNVSARQFRQNDFVRAVAQVLKTTGINPQRLKLELTESLVIANVQDTVQKMQALKALGVRFSMDDFGTGQSSLTYLTTLPLDQLKIDQSFVRNIGVHNRDSVIIDTIIGMATNLGLEVIAEGVETAAQHSFLLAHGCTLFQGYLFAKPVPIADLELALG